MIFGFLDFCFVDFLMFVSLGFLFLFFVFSQKLKTKNKNEKLKMLIRNSKTSLVLLFNLLNYFLNF